MKDRRRDDDVPRSDRRAFLGQASCAAVGTTALFNTVLEPAHVQRAGRARARTTAPWSASSCRRRDRLVQRARPARRRGVRGVRGGARRPGAAAERLCCRSRPRTPDGRAYGLHPGLVELQALFAPGPPRVRGRTSARSSSRRRSSSTGTGSVALPLGLFSHSDQAMHWQTSIPDQPLGASAGPGGWPTSSRRATATRTSR